MWTLSSLQLHRHSLIVVDDDATLELQVKTVKYFKSIESVAQECGFEQMLPKQVLKSQEAKPEVAKANHQPQTNGLKPPGEQIRRSVTPDIVPDKMSSRLQDRSIPENLQSDELSMSSMHSRMPVKAF